MSFTSCIWRNTLWIMMTFFQLDSKIDKTLLQSQFKLIHHLKKHIFHSDFLMWLKTGIKIKYWQVGTGRNAGKWYLQLITAAPSKTALCHCYQPLGCDFCVIKLFNLHSCHPIAFYMHIITLQLSAGIWQHLFFLNWFLTGLLSPKISAFSVSDIGTIETFFFFHLPLLILFIIPNVCMYNSHCRLGALSSRCHLAALQWGDIRHFPLTRAPPAAKSQRMLTIKDAAFVSD